MKKLLIYSFVFFSGSLLFAQDSLSVTHSPLYGSAFANLTGASNIGFDVRIYGARLGHDTHVLLYRSITTTERDPLEFFSSGPFPAIEIHEEAILYGYRWIISSSASGRPFTTDISGGVGKINGVRRGKELPGESESWSGGKRYESLEYSAYGLAVDTHTIFPVSRVFSVGINTFFNVNSQQNIGGLALSLHLGWLY